MMSDRLTGLELQVRRMCDTWGHKYILKTMAAEFERSKEDKRNEDSRVQMALAAAHMREDSEHFG